MKKINPDILAILVYVFLMLAMFRDFLGPGQMLLAYDQTSGSLQWREFMINAIRTFGAFPWWDPYMYGGMPFVGVLHGDIFYPTALFRFFLPVHLVMNWVFIVHGVLAAVLTYFFVKNRMKASRETAFLVGLSYAFTSSLISLVFAGHDGKFIVASLLPGVIYALDAGMEKGRLRYFAVGGLLLGLCFLSPHAQMAYYTYLAAGIWFLFSLVWGFRDGIKWPGLLKRMGYFAVMCILGVTVSAAQFLPALYYSQTFSPRVGKGYEYAITYPIYWTDLIGAVFPGFGGYLDSYWGPNPLKHDASYVGAFAALFPALSLAIAIKKRRTAAALALFVVFTIIALAGHTPLFKLFYYILPGFKKFRAHGMAFILSAFSLNILAAVGLETLREKSGSIKKMQKGALVGIGVVILLGIIALVMGDGFRDFLASAFSVQDQAKLAALNLNFSAVPEGILRVGILMAILWFVAGAWARKKLRAIFFLVIAGVTVAADLWLVDKDFIKAIPEPKFYYAKDEMIRHMEKDDDVFRVMPMFWHMDDNYLMEHGFENMAGHHGQQLKPYMELLEDSLTTIMFHPLACPNLLRYPDFVDILNVKYVVCQPLPRDLSLVPPDQVQVLAPILGFLSPMHFDLIYATREAQLFRNRNYLPRTFIVDSFVVSEGKGVLEEMKRVDLHRVAVFDSKDAPKVALGKLGQWSTRILNYEPNRILVETETDAPAIMIYSGNWYPFWKARLDGQETKALRVDYTLMGVVIPEGRHRVELWYDARLEKLGLLSMGLSLLFVALCLIFPIRRKKDEKESKAR
ncbi:MAG: YfhO family protein [candidate division WOR-3 bacterium]